MNKEGLLQYLIEYDGEQRFNGNRFSSNLSERKRKNEQIRTYDTIKNEYCSNNDITLYRINYKDKHILKECLLNILKKEGVM